MRPQLPIAERLLPYLRRIDEVRVYSNFGPLVQELEQRLAQKFGMRAGHVTTAASGTSAIAGAILAVAGRATQERPLALIPAYTFIGTATAVEVCGFTPYLVDIEAESWLLDPTRLRRHPKLSQVGLVVPVSAYGKPLRQQPWQDFRRETGIPVVIDGAATFETASSEPASSLGDIPLAMSFHATKSFGVGEGGCVVATDSSLIDRTAQALNFGFNMTRNSSIPSINGKLSEYHAAIGLAELDGWAEKQARFEAVIDCYQQQLRRVGLHSNLITGPDVASTYILFRCPDQAVAKRVEHELNDTGIDFRYWYGAGLQGHSHLHAASRDPLEVTARVAATIIGLPMAVDLAEAHIARIADALAKALAKAS